MQIAALPQSLFSAENIIQLGEILADNFGFTGIFVRPVNGEWVITGDKNEVK